MEGYTNNWSSLLPEIVDRLVSLLKETRCWRRDTRALRQLNKHWCLQLDRHVVEVRPHKSRAVVSADVASLLKFHNLTSLDITHFLRHIRQETSEEGLDLRDVIALLPKLSHLDLDRDFLGKVTKEDLEQCVGITSVNVTKGNILENEIHVLSGLPLKYLAVTNYTCDLNVLIAKLTNLRHLSTSIWTGAVGSELAVLSALETVSLQQNGIVIPSLFEVPSLVSCTVGWPKRSTIEQLDGMSKLQHLSIIIDQSSPLEGDAFQSVSRRLTSLKLKQMGRHIALPVGLLNEASSLHSLSLWGFRVSGEMFFAKSLQTLSSLILHMCEFTDGSTFPPMRCLTDLRLGYNTHSPSNLLHRMGLSESSRLRNLKVYHSATPDASVIEQISKMEQLQSIKLMVPLSVFRKYFQKTVLQQLSQLPNLSELEISGPAVREDVDGVLGMEWLANLETLKLTPHSLKEDDHQFLRSKVAALKAKAPHLKFELGF